LEFSSIKNIITDRCWGKFVEKRWDFVEKCLFGEILCLHKKFYEKTHDDFMILACKNYDSAGKA